MQKRTSLLVLGALILAGATYLAYDRQLERPSPEAATRAYENAEYGYALDYPATLSVREYAQGNAVFGTVTGESIDGVAEARVIDLPAAPGQSFQEAATLELQELCAADGPDASFSCPRVDQVQPFVARSGLSGYVVYLAGEMRMIADGQVSSSGKGPFFVLPLGSGATGSRVLVVHPPLNQTAEEADSIAVRAIAESARSFGTDTRPAQSIEDFIRGNIGSISTVAPSLGGRFYVTAIEAHGGTGTVSYEDGHMAYVADFTYELSQEGVPSVTSFTVRP